MILSIQRSILLSYFIKGTVLSHEVDNAEQHVNVQY
jgi:hypothetical protein